MVRIYFLSSPFKRARVLKSADLLKLPVVACLVSSSISFLTSLASLSLLSAPLAPFAFFLSYFFSFYTLANASFLCDKAVSLIIIR